VQLGAPRRDPVTGAKVSVAQTWGRQRLTGSNVEHDPRVTGDAAGSCSIITGTPYQGADTVHGWCEPDAAAAAEERLPRRAAVSPVTGNTPQHGDGVTGTGRGADREVTGSPYFRATTPATPDSAADPLVAIDARFSIASPQRRAQLRARSATPPGPSGAGTPAEGVAAPSNSPAVTGSFAIAPDRVTGNTEFHFRPRGGTDRSIPPAHARLTGEGRAEGVPVTGGAWAETATVTGTEGATAAERNPSERAGKPQAFAGTRQFKTMAKTKPDTARQLVTGLAGWSGKTAAKVTLSGGAQA
jgi:hypothetical protein